MSATVYTVTVTHKCQHEVERPIRQGTESVIREACATVVCQPCKANRVEPIRFASGWGWRTGR